MNFLKKNSSTASDVLLLALFVAAGVLLRTTWHIAPNVEIVTAVSLAAGYFFSQRKTSFLVPLLILAVTDVVIGNTNIWLFTWSAFLVTPALGLAGRNLASNRGSMRPSLLKSIGAGEVAGLVSVLFFFLWTNFGTVVTTTMYPHTFAGVLQSYVAGLPFLWNQLIGNAVFVPLVFGATVAVKMAVARRVNRKVLVETSRA